GLVAASSCGRSSHVVTAPPSASGVEPGVMSPAVDALEFSRFVTDIVASDWSRYARMVPPWSYEASTASWRFVSDGWQRVYVGNGTSSTEIRNQTTISIRAAFLRGGSAQQDLMSADRVRIDLNLRRHRYALDPAYP